MFGAIAGSMTQAAGEENGGPDLDHETEAVIGNVSESFTGWLKSPGDMDRLGDFGTSLADAAIAMVPRLIGAGIVLFLGWIIARIVTGSLRKVLGKTNFDRTLVNFVASLVYMMLMVIVVIASLSSLGVNVSSFGAVIGAAVFALGFALQGSLGNFAAGVMLMIFRPLKEGDLVEAGGVLGTVEEVGVFATIINTLENKKAIVSNSKVTGDNIINYSANGQIRVDMTFGIGYTDDMNKAMDILNEMMSSDERVLKTPTHTVAVFGHGASSVDIVCRPFVKPADYWDVWFDTHKAVKEAFDANGISIPFPQQDVHMHQVS